MKHIQYKQLALMKGVRSYLPHEPECAALCRLQNTNEGRLVVIGNFIDLYDLLRWVDENPLTQFRVMGDTSTRKDEEDAQNGQRKTNGDQSVLIKTTSPATFQPSEQFKHLFSPEGQVL